MHERSVQSGRMKTKKPTEVGNRNGKICEAVIFMALSLFLRKRTVKCNKGRGSNSLGYSSGAARYLFAHGPRFLGVLTIGEDR